MALGLLLMRTNEAKSPAQFQRITLATLRDIWRISANAGVRSARSEADRAGIRITDTRAAPPPTSNVLSRAEGVARKAAEAFRIARKKDSGIPILRTKIETIAATESAGAYNNGRKQAAINLVRQWDATLDRRTCPICERAHGTLSDRNGEFSYGEPGSVHPLCRCTFHLVGPGEL